MDDFEKDISRDLEKVPETWNDQDLRESKDGVPQKKMSFTTKFFLASFLLFLMALGAVYFSILNRGASFSQKKILINAIGPGSITSGENGKIKVEITNNNNVSIEEAYLTMTYDSGENVLGDTNLTNKTVNVGTILANSVSFSELDFSVFGGEGTSKDLEPVLHYKLANSKAEFTKNILPLAITLKSSPVTINVEALKEIHKGYVLSFKISVKNNTETEIKNLLVTARNPHSFVYASSSLPTLNDNPSWKIDILKPKEVKTIEMLGQMTGEIGEKPSFTFYTGLAKETELGTTTENNIQVGNFDNYNLNIENVYSKIEREVLITGQYLDFNLDNEEVGKNYALENSLAQGEMVTLNFTYRNATAFPISDLSLALSLIGDTIVENSVQVSDAFYDPNRMTILWNNNSSLKFAKLGAYESNNLQVKFRVKDKALVGSQLHLLGKAIANRSAEDNVSSEQDISIDKTWTITSREY